MSQIVLRLPLWLPLRRLPMAGFALPTNAAPAKTGPGVPDDVAAGCRRPPGPPGRWRRRGRRRPVLRVHESKGDRRPVPSGEALRGCVRPCPRRSLLPCGSRRVAVNPETRPRVPIASATRRSS
jgi:hypothetical protein